MWCEDSTGVLLYKMRLDAAKGAKMQLARCGTSHQLILDEKEINFLAVVLRRYNEGKGAVVLPSDGFPQELQAMLDNRPIRKIERKD
jgi:hypothetical protein